MGATLFFVGAVGGGFVCQRISQRQTYSQRNSDVKHFFSNNTRRDDNFTWLENLSFWRFCNSMNKRRKDFFQFLNFISPCRLFSNHRPLMDRKNLVRSTEPTKRLTAFESCQCIYRENLCCWRRRRRRSRVHCTTVRGPKKSR